MKLITVIIFCLIGFNYSKAQSNPCNLFGSEPYHLSGYSWNKSDLKYYFKNFTPDLTQAQIRQTFQDAFNKWAFVTGLTFTETSNLNEADITMRWHTEGEFYNSLSPFALTWYPPPYHEKSGSMEFNENITWRIEKIGNGYSDLRYVSLHEIGHVLGLCHSGSSNTVMYYPAEHKLELSQADIDGITSIYIKIKVKNEFKNPDGSISSGGIVNIEYQDYNTNNEPNNEKVLTFNNGSARRLEAKEQIFQNIDRKFNPFIQYNGGWFFNDGNEEVRIATTVVITPNVTKGTYKPIYRYKTNIGLNAITEFNGTMSTGLTIGQIYQYENGNITAPATYQPTGSNINYNFAGWADDLTKPNPRTISPTDNETYTALYKYPNHSNDQNAYTNNSQRKFIRTNNGVLYYIYESLNRVWLERSTDNGITWIIANNGKPLRNENSKNPSMCLTLGEDIFIAFETEWYIWLYQYYPQTNTAYERTNIYSCTAGTNQSKPVVTYCFNEFASVPGPVIIWKSYSDDAFCDVPGLFYAAVNQNNWTYTEGIISNTDINSYNPSIAGNDPIHSSVTWKNDPMIFNLVWEQQNGSNSSIMYYKVERKNNNILEFTQYQNISDGSGFSKNYNPSIITLKDAQGNFAARVCWIGYRQNIMDEEQLHKVTSGENINGSYQEYRMVFKATDYYRFWNFGNEVNSTNMNKADNNTAYFAGWSEKNTHSNKFTDNYTLSSIYNFNRTGDYIQINNGSSRDFMFGNVFNNTALPYAFSLTPSIGSFYSPSKVSALNNIASGREGVVYKDESQFYFTIGDIMADNQLIDFEDIPDTLSVNTKELLNTYLISKPIELNNNSDFTYCIQYGISDSAAAVNVMGENDFINFKVELIDALTGEVLGIFDDITYTKNNLYQYNNLTYQVNTSGLGNRIAKLRLKVDDNFLPKYSLSERYADNNVLLKTKIKQINYMGNNTIDTYDLSQNYPNPFNPSTIINYQIPKDGLVTLTIYDILGNEIRTLLNEHKIVGKYTVTFDASSLASGVYLYQIRINDFVTTKKMLLLK
jgi:hypothetical protein